MKLSGFKSSKCKYKANTTLCHIFLKNFKFYWSCRNRSVTNEEFISRFFFRCGERRKQYQDHDSCYVCALIYWSINAYVINCFSHTETEVTLSGFIILVLKTLFQCVSLCLKWCLEQFGKTAKRAKAGDIALLSGNQYRGLQMGVYFIHSDARTWEPSVTRIDEARRVHVFNFIG